MSKKILFVAGLGVAMLTSTQVMASSYGAGDMFTRFGIARIDPKSNNGDLVHGALETDVKTGRGFAFTLGYRFTDKLGIELLAAAPFKHDVALTDSSNNTIGASVKHLPPTLTAQYYPLGGTDSPVQPYAGVGFNYTRFSSEEIDISGASLDLKSSWGAAGQLGVDLVINDNWALNAAAWYLDIDSEARLNGDKIGTVHIDPLVIMAGASFRF
ncbi:OmpW/AlkL family protein [Halomonas halocynthiae]|uniref:OmpW/AlkL family protein n=1 Tax=Halomonas halocynthiae TaxID=176290 RepID=UPI00040C7C98|nr:OmpW family outer membrane protein [Halomonas halocynthiae]